MAGKTRIKDPAGAIKPMLGGSLHTPAKTRRKLTNKRMVFTTAQNNTRVHTKFWKTLQHFCAVNNAALHVSKITYNKNGWQKVTTDSEGLWFDECLEPHFLTEQVEVTEGLLFCGELDILPTAALPLRGLDNYTGPNSGIVPHTKQQMRSLATMKHEPPKFLYSTGAVTMRNYIKRRAGQLAQYHHVYGALYVEVDDNGDWFVRQLNSDEDGVVFDLNTAYGPGWDTPATYFGAPLITLGDIHLEKLDWAAFGVASRMLAELQPSHVFLHDLIDFEHRNHHNKKDPIFLVQQASQPTVEKSLEHAYDFLHLLTDNLPGTEVVVVKSNHDEAFERWIKEGTGFPDPPNLRFWHQCNYYWMHAVENHDPAFDPLVAAIQHDRPALPRTRFLRADESVVMRDIEHGMHGHLGPRGSKGTPASFRQLGRKSNTGHTHEAGIIDGQWTAGVLGKKDMGYNRGPNGWSTSHIITHPNGKRQMITQRGDKYRA